MTGINQKRSLLVSGAIILLCMTIIVGTTFALFTDTQKVKNHLQAGDLDIKLTRVALTKTTLDENGYLETKTIHTIDQKDKYVDFSKANSENVFDIAVDKDGNVTEKMVPGSKYTATMKLENTSDVAFKYWIEIVCADASKTTALAKQVKITVDADDDYVVNGLKVGSDTAPIGVLEIGDSKEFVVTVEFEDKGYSFDATTGVLTSENDAAKNETIEFDLVVYAVQVTEATTTTTP